MRLLTLLTAALLLATNMLYGQLPQLTASDKASPILLQKLAVDVSIMGNRSITTYTMVFYNPSDKILEGTFNLSLPEGASVTRYALDIEGKMREGVPVEKAKATEVFESIEKRKVDPGLLEKTEGNNFRTRIYPFAAKGVRSIILAFESELTLSKNEELLYHLPLESKAAIPHVTLNIQVHQKRAALNFISSPVKDLSFNAFNEQYCAYVEKEHAVLNKPLSIRIPKKEDVIETFVQKRDGDYYFYLQSFIPPSDRDKLLPKKLTLIWDVSLSGLYRDKEKEISLLQAYLKRIVNASLSLFTLNNTFQSAGTFEVQNGTAKALIQKLQGLDYDGGTDYSKINIPQTDEVLFFTDGISSLSHAEGFKPNQLVYTITTSPKADYTSLKSMAEKSGGAFINLATITEKEGVEKLIRQPLLFFGIKEETAVREYYPSPSTPISNGFSLAGIIKEEAATITLLFGYGNKVAFEKQVLLQYNQYDAPDWNLAKMLAQKKIGELDKQYEKNAATILDLGKQYSLVTRNTSLLVLEDVRDYVQHKIEPPTDLWPEYKRLLQQERETIGQNQKSTLDNAIDYSNKLWAWWNTSYPISKKETKNADASLLRDSVGTGTDAGSASVPPPPPPPLRQEEERRTTSFSRPNTARDEESVVMDVQLEGVLQGRAAGVQAQNNDLQEVVVMGYGSTTVKVRGQNNIGRGNQLIVVNGVPVTNMPPREIIEQVETLTPSAGVALYGSRAMNGVLIVTTKGAKIKEPLINVEEKASAASYLKELSKVSKEKQFQTYLQLRDKNLLNPTFYYDVANFFFKQDKALGLQILTNLGDLDYQNHELHKLFALKLKEWGQYDLQAYVLKQVLFWRPQEPQSYRDYALALMDLGQYQKALDTLYLALIKDYNSNIMSNYEGIEETIVTELNYLINRYGNNLDISAIDKRLLRNMPVDVRVVMNWNMNDTDMDLWVTDPNGEKCYYQNKETLIGGRISKDFTEGYGPEQFLLKKAVKGKYKIQVHYYGENGVKIAGKTTLLVEIFTNYGKSNEQRKLITLQLEEEEKQGIYVGEFVF